MSPAVADLEAFAAAVATFPADADALGLTWSAGARAAAERSLAAHGLLLLGEIHGVAETPLVIERLVAEFGIGTVALEWPAGLEGAAGRLELLNARGPAVGEPIDDVDAFEHVCEHAWLGDGRVTAGHFAVLGRLDARAVGVDVTLMLPGAPPRDATMAANVERALRMLPGPTLVVAGNWHTRQEPDAHGTPAGALLARRRPELCTLELHTRRGRYWSRGPGSFEGPSGTPAGPHLTLDETTEAVVLSAGARPGRG